MQLFEHEWRLNDPLSQGGDGLGRCSTPARVSPVTTRGGAAEVETLNISADLLTLIDFVKRPKRLEVATLRKQAAVITPNLP